MPEQLIIPSELGYSDQTNQNTLMLSTIYTSSVASASSVYRWDHVAPVPKIRLLALAVTRIPKNCITRESHTATVFAAIAIFFSASSTFPGGGLHRPHRSTSDLTHSDLGEPTTRWDKSSGLPGATICTPPDR